MKRSTDMRICGSNRHNECVWNVRQTCEFVVRIDITSLYETFDRHGNLWFWSTKRLCMKRSADMRLWQTWNIRQTCDCDIHETFDRHANLRVNKMDGPSQLKCKYQKGWWPKKSMLNSYILFVKPGSQMLLSSVIWLWTIGVCLSQCDTAIYIYIL